MVIDLGSPYNWCDRRCERCPLTNDCALAIRDHERRAAHRRRGRDASEAETIARDIDDDMKKALERAEEESEEESALEGGEPPRDTPPRCLLSRRGLAFAVATEALLRQYPEHGEAMLAAFLAGAKLSRIAVAVTPSSELDPDWALRCDTLPNIILVERLLLVVSEAVEALDAPIDHQALTSFERAQRDVVRALLPLSSAVDNSIRAALRELASIGRAPSPFCVRPAKPTEEPKSYGDRQPAQISERRPKE